MGIENQSVNPVLEVSISTPDTYMDNCTVHINSFYVVFMFGQLSSATCALDLLLQPKISVSSSPIQGFGVAQIVFVHPLCSTSAGSHKSALKHGTGDGPCLAG